MILNSRERLSFEHRFKERNGVVMKYESDLVSVHRVYDSIEAEIIRSQLESKGIKCFLKSDNAGGSLPYLTATIGIEIIVRKEDAVQAYEIIQEKQT